MRIGAEVTLDTTSPEAWVAELAAMGHSAAYCPVTADADNDTVVAYASAAREAGILIAEVGAWSNPIDPDDGRRREAISYCQRQLDLAERIGANCCVNIAGTRGPAWDGPDPENLTDDTFELVVDSVREIIDAVQPRRSYYTLEMMQWALPDSPDCYLRLLDAIARPQLGAHLDPVNLLASPRRLFSNAQIIAECFRTLGPHVRSCHAKDAKMEQKWLLHIEEVPPGLGSLDYRAYIAGLDALDSDLPMMVEHLDTNEEYAQAVSHIRSVAKGVGVTVR